MKNSIELYKWAYNYNKKNNKNKSNKTISHHKINRYLKKKNLVIIQVVRIIKIILIYKKIKNK